MARTSRAGASINLGVNTRGASQDLRGFSRQLNTFVTSSRGQLGGVTAGWNKMAVAIGAAGLAVTGLAMAYGVATRAYEKFQQVDTARRRAATAGPGGSYADNLGRASQLGPQAAAEYGIPETQIQGGYYEAFAANAQTWEEASDLVEIGARNFWIAGTDIKATIGIYKTYADTFGVSAETFADSVTTLAQSTRITEQQFAQFGANYLPSSQGIGMNLNQTLAMQGVLVRSLKPEQAATRQAAFISELENPSSNLSKAITRATGKSVRDVISSDELIQTLSGMRETMGTDQFNLLTGSREVRDVMRLLANANTYYKQLMKSLEDSEGAFKEKSDFIMLSMEKEAKSFQQTMEGVWNEIGEAVGPAIQSFQEDLGELAQKHSGTFARMMEYAATATSLVGGAISGFETATNWFLNNRWINPLGFGSTTNENLRAGSREIQDIAERWLKAAGSPTPTGERINREAYGLDFRFDQGMNDQPINFFPHLMHQVSIGTDGGVEAEGHRERAEAIFRMAVITDTDPLSRGFRAIGETPESLEETFRGTYLEDEIALFLPYYRDWLEEEKMIQRQMAMDITLLTNRAGGIERNTAAALDLNEDWAGSRFIVSPVDTEQFLVR